MRKIKLALPYFFLTFLVTPAKALAGTVPSIGTVNKDNPDLNLISFNDLVRNGVLIALAFGGLIFFSMLILGGLKYLSSAGDEKAAASARGTLTNAFIGLVIMVAAFVISGLIFNIFKLPGVSVE